MRTKSTASSIDVTVAALVAYALIGGALFAAVNARRVHVEMQEANRAQAIQDIRECFVTAAFAAQPIPWGEAKNESEGPYLGPPLPAMVARCGEKVSTLATDSTWPAEPQFARFVEAVHKLQGHLSPSMAVSAPVAVASSSASAQATGELIKAAHLAELLADRAQTRLSTTRLGTTCRIILLFSTYLVGLLTIKCWASWSIIRPLRALIKASKAAPGKEPLALPVGGPREVRELSLALTSYIDSLREDVHQGAEQLSAANHKLRQVNATLAQTHHDAYHDGLTKLPNRYLLKDRIRQLVERSKRDQEFKFGILFIDLDDFKHVNDSLGHSAGDKVLMEVAKRVCGVLRSFDTVSRPTTNTAARIGGDEFVVLLQEIHGVDDAVQVATRIQQHLIAPMYIDTHRIVVSASIGITISDGLRLEDDALLRDADTAMYQAKQAGKMQHAVFIPAMHAEAAHRFELQNDLRGALERGEFELYYQPIVALDGGRIDGFEALIRWKRPRLGMVSPAEFIPLAEESGLIQPIGQWVLHQACTQLRQWQDEYPQARDLSMSVNVSKRQLDAPELCHLLQGILSKHRIAPRHLNIELTEGTVLDKSDHIPAVLEELKKLGVSLHLDDFGTGYSTLGCLQKFPIDVIKLDRSFVQAIGDGRKDASIISGVMTMARNLRLRVVAEGIEDRETLAALVALDCDLGQGYYFSKPMTAAEAGKLLGTGGHWLSPGDGSLPGDSGLSAHHQPLEIRYPSEPAPGPPNVPVCHSEGSEESRAQSAGDSSLRSG